MGICRYASPKNKSLSHYFSPHARFLGARRRLLLRRVVRNTRNPVYDEDFTFYGLSFSELSDISLHFVVLSFDRYSRDDIIGEVVCSLNSLDVNQIESQQVALSKEIQPRSLKVI